MVGVRACGGWAPLFSEGDARRPGDDETDSLSDCCLYGEPRDEGRSASICGCREGFLSDMELEGFFEDRSCTSSSCCIEEEAKYVEKPSGLRLLLCSAVDARMSILLRSLGVLARFRFIANAYGLLLVGGSDEVELGRWCWPEEPGGGK